MPFQWTFISYLLDLCWPSTGPLQNLYWTSYWTSHWTPTELLLDRSWISTGPLLDLYWTDPGSLLHLYWTLNSPTASET